MSQHPNVRLAPRGRNLLCERIGGSHGKPMTDRPCRPRALVMFTPPEAEDLVCEDTADLLLARAAVTGVRPVRYEREEPGSYFTST
ncbi:hypothetical protein [Parolsenella catena]|uniref:hypothetical protein n=1 Tax=Parolsenella catena TaxID=2003188 RepID=UPI003A8E4A68